MGTKCCYKTMVIPNIEIILFLNVSTILYCTKASIELSIFNWRHIYINTVIIIYLAASM